MSCRSILCYLLVGLAFLWPSSYASVERQARVFDVWHIVTSPDQAVSGTRAPAGMLIPSEGGGYPDEREFELMFEETSWESGPFDPAGTEVPYGSAIGPEDLVSLVRSFIAEDSWTNKKNSIRFEGRKITVVQTPDVLREIEIFLRALQARRMSRIDIDVALVPPAAFDGALRDARERAAEPWLPEGIIDAAVGAAGGSAIQWHATLAEGEAAAVEPVSRTAALVDLEVNQTGVIPVQNPCIGILKSGLGLMVRPSATPLSEVLQLDFEIGMIRARRTGEPRRLPVVDLDLPETSGVFLKGSIIAPGARTILLGELRDPRELPEPLVVLASLRRIGPPQVDNVPVGILEVGTFIRAWPGSTEEGRPLHERDWLLASARDALPEELRRDPRTRLEIVGSALFVAVAGDAKATGRAVKAIGDHLGILFENELRGATIEVWLGSVGASDMEKVLDPEAGRALLKDDWRKAIRLERETSIRLVGIPGQRLSLWAGNGRSYLADVEQVSGGSGPTVIEVADPIVGWTGTGTELIARVKPVPGKPWVQAWLAGVAAETEFGRSRAVRADRRVELGGPKGVRPIGPMIDIELPVQKADEWKHVVTIPAGRAWLLDAFPDPHDPKRIRILVLEATVHVMPAQ